MTLTTARVGRTGKVVAVAAAVIAVGAGGVAALAATATASTPKVIHGCYATSGGALRIASSCKAGEKAISWNAKGPKGPAGPSGINAVYNVSIGFGTPNATGVPHFQGATATVVFAKDTAAVITGSLDYADLNDTTLNSYFGTCYERSGTSTPTITAAIEPEFLEASADVYLTQTVSGVVGHLSPGTYKLGVCTKYDDDDQFGYGTASVLVTNAGVAANIGVLRAGVTHRQGRP
jgi:hypothetical protein